MGCDIHLYVEKRQDGKWVSADAWVEDEDMPGRKTLPYKGHFYNNRNYDLFAILADVRNGKGFAGCGTGSGFEPLSPPKGLPPDVCEEIKIESDSLGSDGHSHSWCTLAELLSYDWTRRTNKSGWLNGKEYFEWCRYNKENGKGPESWCGGVTGQRISHVPEAEMSAKIEGIKKKGKGYQEIAEAISSELGNTYCLVEWNVSYHSACSDFWANTMPRLLNLGKQEDVRIVFWFDN